MSFLDELQQGASTAQRALDQAAQLAAQGEALFDTISGRNRGTSAPRPPTMPEPLKGFQFSPLVIAGIFGVVIVGLALSVRR
jgi:hypothetical protein